MNILDKIEKKTRRKTEAQAKKTTTIIPVRSEMDGSICGWKCTLCYDDNPAPFTCRSGVWKIYQQPYHAPDCPHYRGDFS